jgi:ABC-type lipoprotein export system ATPase subunit
MADIRNRKIGFVFQSYHLIPRLSARENVELPLMLAGVPAKRRHADVEIILEKLGNIKEAEKSYEEALKYSPESETYKYALNRIKDEVHVI